MDHLSHFEPYDKFHCVKCKHCGDITHFPDKHECVEMVRAERDELRAEVERWEHLLSVVACRATGGMLAQTGYDETVYLDQIDAYRKRECETCEVNMVSEIERLRTALQRLVGYGDIYRYRVGEISPYEQAVAALASGKE